MKKLIQMNALETRILLLTIVVALGIVIMSLGAHAADVTLDLYAKYNGTSENDTLGNYNMTNTNVTFNSNGEFVFNGLNSNLLRSTSLLAINTTNSWTFTGWINTTTCGTYQQVFRNVNYTNDRVVMDIVGTDCTLRLSRRNSTAAFSSKSSKVLTAGTAYFVAVGYDGTNLFMYLNGEKQTGSQGATTTSFTGFALGVSGASNYFNGTMDNIRVYNRSLSTSEIMDLWNLQSNDTGTCINLVDNMSIDISGNMNVCTNTYYFSDTEADGSLKINNNITVVNGNNAVIYGNNVSGSSAIVINGVNNNISNFNLYNYSYGVRSYANNNLIENMTLSNHSTYAIIAQATANNTIIRNINVSESYDLIVYYSYFNQIYNIGANNYFHTGIDSHNPNIENATHSGYTIINNVSFTQTTFDSLHQDNAGSAVYLVQSSYNNISNITFTNLYSPAYNAFQASRALYIEDTLFSQNNRINNLVINNVSAYCMKINGNNTIIDNVSMNNCGREGILIQNYSSATNVNKSYNRFSNISSNQTTFFVLASASIANISNSGPFQINTTGTSTAIVYTVYPFNDVLNASIGGANTILASFVKTYTLNLGANARISIGNFNHSIFMDPANYSLDAETGSITWLDDYYNNTPMTATYEYNSGDIKDVVQSTIRHGFGSLETLGGFLPLIFLTVVVSFVFMLVFSLPSMKGGKGGGVL